MSRRIHFKTFAFGQCSVNIIALFPIFSANVYCTGDGTLAHYVRASSILRSRMQRRVGV